MHNIMYVITELDIGGAEKTLFELTTRLDRKRFSPRVACLTGHGPMGTKFAEHNIPVHYLDMANKADFLPIFRLRKLLKKHDIHILHSFLFHANMVGRIAAFLARTPIVISDVRVAEPRHHHLWWDRWTSFMIDVEVCVSETIRHFTAAEARIDPNKLITISNSIDLS